MSDWHVDQPLAEAYAAGTLAVPLAASLEAHVAGCTRCQVTVGAAAPQARLETVWRELVDRVDEPRVGWFEQGLRRVGLTDGDARLAVSTPALRVAWFLSVAFLLTFAVLASQAPRVGPDLFLLLAPVLPVLGVGVAYGPWVDPTYETTLAAPFSSVRLIVLRTGIVLVFTSGLALVAGVLLPGQGTAVVWLLPSAALVAVTLALSAWVAPLAAALATSGVWLLGIYALWVNNDSLDSVFTPAAQGLALALLAVAVLSAVLAQRAHAY
ncbi:MAG TPA: hypothetical protein VES02_03030, partial [Dermatophilaceae bacterium]|nr:hypothetical protein [Dermatophilaceae bacterium]